MSRPPRIPGLAAALALLCLGLSAAPALGAEGEHVFDAGLSLTGDCSVSASVDPAPDPGCPEGAHPPKPFSKHGAVAVDHYGNRYVASLAKANGSESRVDVFSSDGEFITQVKVAMPQLVGSIAVDSQGVLYVYRFGEGEKAVENLIRFEPTQYEPAAANIAYNPTPVQVPFDLGAPWLTDRPMMAVDRTNDHLFLVRRIFPLRENSSIVELNSAAEGNTVARSIQLEGIIDTYQWTETMALDATRRRLYVSDLNKYPTAAEPTQPVVKAFDLDAPADPEAPRQLLFTIDGSTTPTNRFVSETRVLPLAVDESSGHLFVGDLEAPNRRIYEFDTAGEPVGTIEGGLAATGAFGLHLAHDNSPTSPTQGYLFVPSGDNPGRSLAFGPPPPIAPPLVSGLSATAVSASDATLRGLVNPKGLPTEWRIEYTTEQSFLANGFEGAILAGEGTLPVADEDFAVAAPAIGLSPGTAYRFRILAENEEGEEEAQAAFSTFEVPTVSNECPNRALRTGPSATLPDCRAYELVTPTKTNGRAPQLFGGIFPAPAVSPGGAAVSFAVEGTVLPGLSGTANLAPDPYLARRGPDGWRSESTGPDGDFSTGVLIGSRSPDQAYVTWRTDGKGPGVLEGVGTAYLRYPDGHFEPAGEGSLATDPGVAVRLIAENGTHMIFDTDGEGAGKKRRLEPEAPPNGTAAIYDRTADGALHVVSLLPGDVTPAAGQDAKFRGASLDGRGVAFEIGGTLYLRHDNEETLSVGAGVSFVGLAAGGRRVFYLQGGDLMAFDSDSGEAVEFSQSGDVVPVNVPSGGEAAYFVSQSALGGEPNPEGDAPVKGERNLYLSREGQISFVATLSQRDVEGVKPENGHIDATIRGLGLWNPAWPAIDPSRATADGSVLLFESNAPLTGYDPEGHTQVYRYDAGAGSLDCLSCNPTGFSAGDNALQAVDSAIPLLRTADIVKNLSADGRRAFFESTEALAADDLDGLRDVYEWEQEGKGGCERAGGCLYLIGVGNSARDEYIWGASDSGDDVMFLSADLLTPADRDETASIYDARVGGGFAAPQGPPAECLGESCQPAVAAPDDPTPTSAAFRGAGDLAGAPGCAAAARRAAKLSRQARRLRTGARGAASPHRAKRMRVGAKRLSRRARALAKRSERCRRASRRAAR